MAYTDPRFPGLSYDLPVDFDDLARVEAEAEQEAEEVEKKENNPPAFSLFGYQIDPMYL